MNISLIVISDGWGGAESVVYELAKHMREKEQNVSIILNEEIAKYYANLDGVELFSIGSHPLYKPKIFHWKGRGLVDTYLWELVRPLYLKAIRKRLERFLLTQSTEIMYALMPEAIFLAVSTSDMGIPIIGAKRSEATLPQYESKIISFVKKPINTLKLKKTKSAFERIDGIVFQSKSERDSFSGLSQDAHQKSVIIGNGLDLLNINRDALGKVDLKGEFNILFPGGAKPGKGGNLVVGALSKIMDRIKGLHLYIALDVPVNHTFRKIVMESGLEECVTFTGFLEKQNYRKLLNSVDLLVMPSRSEGFANVYLEAMGLGKPIVAANVSSIPEVVIDGRNGILTELNADSVADAILRLYRDDSLRKQIAENNLEDIKRFDWNSITDRYIELYESFN